MSAFRWTCPFCGDHQMVADENHDESILHLLIGVSALGRVGLEYLATRCVNADCNEVSLNINLIGVRHGVNGLMKTANLESWTLRPDGASKVQPEYIPQVLREDYYEACLIRDKSPKASATLSRRCLQGMIRDFCDIAKGRLVDEIAELKKRIDNGNAPKGVEAEAIDAIDAVRNVGNIGAHMEKDIDLIVEVDPGEAQALIELIEMLFEDWYVARHKREQRLATVIAIAAEKSAQLEEKKAQLAQSKAAALSAPPNPDDE